MLGIGSYSKGDTLVEVLFAITIFSLVAVGGLSIMNQGTATSQRALEITLVRQEIDAQAEALRFLNSSYIAAYRTNDSYKSTTPAGQWDLMLDSILATANVSASDFGGTSCGGAPNGSFVINTRDATFVAPSEGRITGAQTFSQVVYDSSDQVVSAEGIWVEAVRSQDSVDIYQQNTGYIDFHIRACWDSPGQSIPVTIGTIVRLYEPRG